MTADEFRENAEECRRNAEWQKTGKGSPQSCIRRKSLGAGSASGSGLDWFIPLGFLKDVCCSDRS
jgi:hypothetical protein